MKRADLAKQLILLTFQTDDVLVRMAEPSLLLDEVRGHVRDATFLFFPRIRDHVIREPVRVFRPDLQLGIAKPAGTLRSGCDDGVAALEMSHLTGNARNSRKVPALGKADEKVPVFKEIEPGIESPALEEKVPRHEQRGQGNVVVHEQEIAIEIGREKTMTGPALVRPRGSDAQKCRDRVRVPRDLPADAVCSGDERRKMFGIEE